MRSLRLGESSWLSINNGRRQTSPGGGKGRCEGTEGEKEREREVTEKEKWLVISVVSPPSPFMVCRVSWRKTKRWSTFGQHMSRICSGHGGTKGRKKNRDSSPVRWWPWSIRNYLRGDDSRDCSDMGWDFVHEMHSSVRVRVFGLETLREFDVSNYSFLIHLSILSGVSCGSQLREKNQVHRLISGISKSAWTNGTKNGEVLAGLRAAHLGMARKLHRACTCAYE